jgi:hypothetical protein
MRRILLAFGDSHTAGAEIDAQYNPTCYDRAYPAYIAKHYGFDYENLATSGGSNDWMIRQFMIRIQHSLIKKEKVFVLCNFCESSRTYILLPDKLNHCTVSQLYPDKVAKNKFLPDPDIVELYKNYLRTHSSKVLNYKSLSQIFIIQTICDQHNIPYIFHSSTDWYIGNWDLINKKNYFGHHSTKKLTYTKYESLQMFAQYSYWGAAIHNPDWANLIKNSRWSMHYPESYHKFWAETLINFIDEQKILEGYI